MLRPVRAFWLGVGMIFAVGCFADHPVTRISRSGVEARRVEVFEEADENGTMTTAPGDFVLTGGGLHVVVGGFLREGDARGAVLEMVFEGKKSGTNAVLHRQTVYVDGVEWRIRIKRMHLIERRNVPVLRIEGEVALSGRTIEVSRELSIGNVPGTLSVSTRLYSERGEYDVRLGAQLVWGGPLPFMSKEGVLDDEAWHRGEWVGGEGANASVCFGYQQGKIAARARFEERGGAKLLLRTDATQAQPFNLKPRVPHYEKSALALAAPGVAAAVRKFGMWRGKMFPEFWVDLPERFEGREVLLFDDERRPMLQGRPDDEGRVALPLAYPEEAPQSYTAVATAYGHALSEELTFRPGELRSSVMRIPEGGQIRVRVRDVRTQEPLSARVRLLALEDTKKPALGPDYRASGAGDTVITTTGQVSIPVPRGRYKVLVTRGPEFSLVEKDVDVTETFSPRIDADLAHQVDPGDWLGCDLHLHAAPSPDSEVSIEDRLASLVAEGVRFAVATDHNHVTDYGSVLAKLPIEGLAVESGVEVTTEAPIFGHFNAYPYPLDPVRPGNGAPAYSGVDPGSLFRALHQVDPDLVVQVNHPRLHGGIGYFDVMGVDTATGVADPSFSLEFDTLEVFNGFDLGQRANVDQVFDDWLKLLSRGNRIFATGSSDSHQVRYQLAGYPRTYAQVPAVDHNDPRAIIRAIKAGASFVTSGPFLEAEIEGGGPGTTVLKTGPNVALSVRVRAPDWMPVEQVEVFVGTERVFTKAVPKLSLPAKRARAERSSVRFAQKIPLRITDDTFVVVRVSSKETIDRFYGRYGVVAMAFSNPIFVDADGDGRTPWSVP